MNAVNAVQLFILVWTFTAVCQANKDVIISCDDVTGSVGKEVNLTCSVSLQLTECCITNYKFQYPDINNGIKICKQVLPEDSCEQRNSVTCRYTPPTAMREQFRFFMQTKCGLKRTNFTVAITAPTSIKAEDPQSKYAIIAVGCIILIIIVTIICKTKPNFTKPCGFQKRMFLCIKHNEDNSIHPEDVI